ncbi:MAG: phospholipase D-like domain-containing protein, partial [Rhodoferax sp.]
MAIIFNCCPWSYAFCTSKVVGLNDTQMENTVSEQTLALALFAQSHRSVTIVPPYFIPGARGIEIMRRGVRAGGEVTLVTNANDEPLVHASYSCYRLDMLRAGVSIREISPTLLASPSGRLGSFGRSTGRLHAKVAVIDRRLVFIGAMNLAARSALANTEVGLVIESPAIVDLASNTLFRKLLLSGWYALRLTPDRSGIKWARPDPTAQGPSTAPSPSMRGCCASSSGCSRPSSARICCEPRSSRAFIFKRR